MPLRRFRACLQAFLFSAFLAAIFAIMVLKFMPTWAMPSALGVSFCAAAARMNVPLTEWDEPLHVIPAAHRAEVSRELAGTYVLMKSGSRMKEIKELLTTGEREVFCVENCGMENERVYLGAENIPEDAGYFSTVIAKEK